MIYGKIQIMKILGLTVTEVAVTYLGGTIKKIVVVDTAELQAAIQDLEREAEEYLKSRNNKP